MDIIVAGRQAGKTHYLIEWVKEGNKVPWYPGWDRIIVTSTVKEAERLRHMPGVDYHMVYSFIEYTKGRFPNSSLEIMVDDLEFLLGDLFRQHGLKGFTMTGHATRLHYNGK